MKIYSREYTNVGFSEDLCQGKAICITKHKEDGIREWSLLIKKNCTSHLILVDSFGDEETLSIEDYLENDLQVVFLEKPEMAIKRPNDKQTAREILEKYRK